jgi:hypothetical protein
MLAQELTKRHKRKTRDEGAIGRCEGSEYCESVGLSRATRRRERDSSMRSKSSGTVVKCTYCISISTEYAYIYTACPGAVATVRRNLLVQYSSSSIIESYYYICTIDEGVARESMHVQYSYLFTLSKGKPMYHLSVLPKTPRN